MAVENITSPFIPEALVENLVSLSTIFQAIGGLIILYIIFGILNIIWNRRRSHEITRMRQILEQINKKLDNTQIRKKK